MTEDRATMLKRLHMRSIRRGIKEMDLILTAFAQSDLPALSDDELALYDALLRENDHDLYAWVTGQSEAPPHYAGLMTRVTAGARGLTRPAPQPGTL